MYDKYKQNPLGMIKK